MRIVEEEENRKIKMYFTRGNEVDELTYLANIRRFQPMDVDEENSVGIDSQTGLPNPACPDDSPNVHDYVWVQLIAFESVPESWPEFNDDFPQRVFVYRNSHSRAKFR